MKNPQNQGEILQDKNSKGKARDWRGRKLKNIEPAHRLEILLYHKKRRIKRLFFILTNTCQLSDETSLSHDDSQFFGLLDSHVANPEQL